MDDDWSQIQPLTEAEAKAAVKNYFNLCGLVAKEIDHSNNKNEEKTPDLVVLKDKEPIFLCEIKTPGHYLDQITKMYLWKNVYDRLRDRLRTARKQLETYDPKHKLPRLVAFTSNHPQLNFTNCQHNILGVVGFGTQILQDFRRLPEYKYSEKNKRSIDMILWCQVNRHKKNVFETEHFINTQSKSIEKVRVISGLLVPTRRFVFDY